MTTEKTQMLQSLVSESNQPDQILANEEMFHDAWASSIRIDDVYVDEFFEACTSPENRIIREWLGDVRGKCLLELGCGAGEASVYFAKQGAIVTATDISTGMLQVVEQVAARHNVQLTTKQSYGHAIAADDASYDIVYAANLLHHVDITPTLVEVKRVLKDGGVFVAWDPLAHNPLIKVYRRLATEVRTDDEHPLTMSDLSLFNNYFQTVTCQMTWFCTLWIFLKFYLIDRANPNKERYWKKILLEHQRLQPLYQRLEKFDRVLLRLFPFLRRYCWNVVVMARK